MVPIIGQIFLNLFWGEDSGPKSAGEECNQKEQCRSKHTAIPNWEGVLRRQWLFTIHHQKGNTEWSVSTPSNKQLMVMHTKPKVWRVYMMSFALSQARTASRSIFILASAGVP